MATSSDHIEAPLQAQEAFGKAVRLRLHELELSQEELGARFGLDRTYVSVIEGGGATRRSKRSGRSRRGSPLRRASFSPVLSGGSRALKRALASPHQGSRKDSRQKPGKKSKTIDRVLLLYGHEGVGGVDRGLY